MLFLGHLSTSTPDFNFGHGKWLDLNNTISRIQTKQLGKHLKWSSTSTYSICYNGILLGLILSKSSSIKQIRQHSYKYADQQIAPGNELTKNCCIRHMRPNILKTELSSDTSSLAICFYHVYIMEMKDIAIGCCHSLIQNCLVTYGKLIVLLQFYYINWNDYFR